MRGWVVALGLLPQDAGPGAPAPFVESQVRLPKADTRIALLDLDGDGDRDLVRASSGGLEVRLLGDDRRLSPAPPARLAFPGGRSGWDLADLDGDGAHEVLSVEEGAVRAFRLEPDGQAFDGGRVVLEARTALPSGLGRVRVARDVDGDGRVDLVLPGAGVHRIHLARGEGFAAPIEVAFELAAGNAVGDPQSLSSVLGQSLVVPWFEIRDVDGDGDSDLVGRTRERVAFHLADPALASQPTWVLDLEALRAELPRRHGFDLDDLFSNLEGRVDWRIADLDGKPPLDLVVTLGSKLRVYLGGTAAGPVGDPDQVLKSSGTVLWTFLRPIEGSGLVDLQLVRAERISIGRVVRSLILPSAIDFDFYAYENQGGTFSRRPTRTNRITLAVPRLLSVIDDADAFEEEFKEQWRIPARRLPRAPDRPAAGDDVIDVEKRDLLLFRGVAPAPNVLEEIVDGRFDPERVVEGYFLEDLDRRGDGAERRIDLGDLSSFDFAPGTLLRRACQGVEPERYRLPFGQSKLVRLLTPDLDGDGRADVVVVGQDLDTMEWILVVLVRSAS